MTTVVTRAQDIIRCSICEGGAYYHCLKCGTILCDDCTSKHLSDKSKRHEIVSYTSKRRSFAFDYECPEHKRIDCEIYCKDCKTAICTKCVTGEHKKHNFADLEDVVDDKRAEILGEIQDIESTMLQELQQQKNGVNNEEYETTIESIFTQEDLICKAVREAGSKLREQVAIYKKENEENANKNAFEEEEVLKVIQTAKSLLESEDSKAILEFKGLKNQLNVSPCFVDRTTPFLVSDAVNIDTVSSMFGALVFPAATVDDKPEVHLDENLREQSWFHGFITREEAERLLKKNGEFLVREVDKGSERDRFVISTFRDGMTHFLVTREPLERRVGPNGTVLQLVRHLQRTGEALSPTNPSILKFPVDRDMCQLNYNQIKLQQKMEIMQSGHNLFRGTFGGKAVLVSSDLQEESRLYKNAHFLRFFSHPNIVELEGYSALQKPVLLVMESMSEGPLLMYLRKNATSITTRKKTNICLDVAKGLEYIHLMRCIHRDVAARNCLVHANGTVKIFDFWMTEVGEVFQVSERFGRQIPIKWTAPEALLTGKYTQMCDVWSFGVLMWEVFSCGQLPYTGMNNKDTMEKIPKGYRMDSPKDTPKSCSNLMSSCWQENPDKRCVSSDIVRNLQTTIKTMN